MKLCWVAFLGFSSFAAPIVTVSPPGGTRLDFDSTLQITLDAKNEDGTRTNLTGRFMTVPTNGTAMTTWVRTTSLPYTLTLSNMPPGIHRYRFSAGNNDATTDLLWDVEVGPIPEVPAGPFTLMELGQDVFPTAINNQGQIIGYIKWDGKKRAFLQQNGVRRDLQGFSSGESSAVDINENGMIVGWSMTEAGKKNAAVWMGEEIKPIGTLNNENSFATGLNDLGHIVGIDGDEGFVQQGEILRKFRVTPYAINNNGLIVGGEVTAETMISPFEFVSIQGGVHQGTQPDIAHRVLLTVNNSGMAAGWGYVKSFKEYGHNSMLYKTRSQFEAIRTGSGNGFDENLSINKWGQYVGFNQPAYYNVDPYRGPLGYNLLTPKATFNSADLSTMLATPTDLVLTNATGINDWGQVVGVGTRNGTNFGFLLTPLLKLNIEPAGQGKRIEIAGNINQEVELQSSDDLIHWNVINTNSVTTEAVHYDDTSAAPRRYYRSVRVK